MNKLKTPWALGGGLLAAITSSLCCVGPMVAGMAGAAALFEKWRPLFLFVTFALLARAWYLSYRQPDGGCREAVSCPAGKASKWNKLALWLATIFVLAAAAFPALSSAFSRGRDPACCAAPAATGVRNQTGVESSIPKETR